MWLYVPCHSAQASGCSTWGLDSPSPDWGILTGTARVLETPTPPLTVRPAVPGAKANPMVLRASQFTCENCERPFSPKKSHPFPYPPRFCSRSCAISHRNKVTAVIGEKSCEWCHKSFTGFDNKRWRSRRYCSRQCASQYRASLPSSDLTRIRQKQAALACSLVTRCLRHKGKDKSGRIRDMLGYEPSDLVAHLERLWKPGMDWSNYGKGGWHVDHIRPVRSFPPETPVSVMSALSNLQPLWESENCSKGGRYEGDI